MFSAEQTGRQGGLARVNGRVRLVEGLAMPREEVEFQLSYYNSNTCWIDLDPLLTAFGLTREDMTVAGQASIPALRDGAGFQPAVGEKTTDRLQDAGAASTGRMPALL